MARCWPPRRLDARRCAEDEGATQEITSAAWESRDQVQTACSLRMFYDVPPWRWWWSCCWKRNQWWSWKSVDTAPELSRMFWIWTATILLPLMLFGTANRTIEVPKMDHKWLGHAGSLMATNTRNTIFLMAHITNFRPVFGHVFPPRVLTNSWPQETYAMMGINLEVMLQEMRASADVLPAAGEPGGDGLLG